MVDLKPTFETARPDKHVETLAVFFTCNFLTSRYQIEVKNIGIIDLSNNNLLDILVWLSIR
jgi:hypothetical protein